MKKLFLIAATFVALAPAISFAADSACDELAKAVEDGVKQMALYDEEALGTPPAEVTNRRLSMVVEATRVQSNLMLMQANKCSMPRTPINPRVYFESAFACAHAIPKSGGDPIPECDRDKWKRSTK